MAMETYTISPKRKTELQSEARTLAVRAADKHTFEFPECRNIFIDGFIEGFIEEMEEMTQALRYIGIDESAIAEAIKRTQGNVSIENKIQ